MWKNLLYEFWTDLRTQKLRAFLTMFAIAWGTITVVVLLAFGEGLRDTMQRGLLNAGDRVLMVMPGQTTRAYEGMPAGRRIRMTMDDLDALQQVLGDRIDASSVAYGRWGTRIRNGDRRSTGYMEAVYPDFEALRRLYPVAGGRFLNNRDLTEKRRVVFLGDEMARRLFGEEDPVGSDVEIDGATFTVIGVMQTKLQTSMNNGPDSERIIIPASTYATMYGGLYVGQLLLRPANIADTPAIRSEIFRVLGARHRFDSTDEHTLWIWDFIENQRQQSMIFLGIQIFLGVIGGLTLLVAGIGLANIMYVIAKERTREIGIKRALGARRRHIVTQFVFESTLLSFVGGGVGLAVSLAVVFVVAGLPKGNDAMEFLTNPQVSMPIALLTIAILGGIGLLAGVLPARRAAQVDPVEALRWE
jgi:putative ABC transport system permease protein